MDHKDNKHGKAFLEQVKQNGTEGAKGAHTAVILDETVYGISRDLAGTVLAASCPEEKCVTQRSTINEICKMEGWLPGKAVLICDTTGYCCNCYCL